MTDRVDEAPTGITAANAASAARTPMFSLIVSCYNVAAFLPDFLESLVKQRCPLEQVDLVFVNDGSPDDSAEVVRAWAAEHAPHTVVVDQPNGGLSAARNTGLSHARGSWVSFPDPDDVLEPGYLRDVQAFISREGPEPSLVCTRLIMLDDTTGDVTDSHPLRRKFQTGTQLVWLNRHPQYIQLSSASAFYRRDMIERLSLRFDSAIKPHFEDAFFTALYLAEHDDPSLGIVATARYRYRYRSDGSSLVQSSWQREEKFSVLPRLGYLRLAQVLAERLGHVPLWAQNTILYDLLFYFRAEDMIHSPTAGIPERVCAPFHDTVREILALIDTEAIDGFDVIPTNRELKNALILYYKQERQRPTSVPLARMDVDRQIVLLRYQYTGRRPEELFRVRGIPIRPVHEKIRDISYFGRVLMHERIVWLPATGTIRLTLDGRPVPLTYGQPVEPVYLARPAVLWRRLSRRRVPSGPWPESTDSTSARSDSSGGWRQLVRSSPRAMKLVTRGRAAKVRLDKTVVKIKSRFDPPRPSDGVFAHLDPRHDRALVARASSHAARSRYGKAWTLIDRDTQAHDNAEHLYRHLHRSHPQINAWFVLRRDSADWGRLAAEGFRLVEFGSAEHVVLLLNTAHLISSQIDHYIVQPLDRARFGRGAWRYTFLQHGVTKDDLSKWINSKPISLLVTTTPDEHAGIAGDHTPYIFTEKETRMVGMPRLDRLLELAQTSPEPRRVVMPTWRRALLGETIGSGNRRKSLSHFADSPFAQAWTGLINDEALHAELGRLELRLAFMPHPNMRPYLDQLRVHPDVTLLDYARDDVQEVLCSAAVVVTDYSSMAFEAAFLQRPVVYYQFDRDEFFAGGHAYRKGQWDYELNGFGPVTTDHDQARDALLDAIRRQGRPAEPYARRMVEAFPLRDGGNCERVVGTIRALNSPLTYAEAYRPARSTS